MAHPPRENAISAKPQSVGATNFASTAPSGGRGLLPTNEAFVHIPAAIETNAAPTEKATVASVLKNEIVLISLSKTAYALTWRSA
jgi:hypothetical protein